jgi:hypothetical protein
MRRQLLCGTIAVLSLAIAACDQNRASSNTPASGGTQTATQEPAPGSETVSATRNAVAGGVGTVSKVQMHLDMLKTLDDANSLRHAENR